MPLKLVSSCFNALTALANIAMHDANAKKRTIPSQITVWIHTKNKAELMFEETGRQLEMSTHGQLGVWNTRISGHLVRIQT